MPLARCAAGCPQEQQHGKVSYRLGEPVASYGEDINPIAQINDRCEQTSDRQEHQGRDIPLQPEGLASYQEYENPDDQQYTRP